MAWVKVSKVPEAITEEFQLRNSDVMVGVGRSGTGGGFSRFCRGETDVATASRRIRDVEAERCASQGVEFLELPVALDGLSVIVNPANTFVSCLTVEELRQIWRPGSPVRTWRDVRPEFPGEPIQLYGPGTASGTFDTFTQAIVGDLGASRTDFQASENDNLLVQGIVGDRYSLGYFGYSYLIENQGALKVVEVDGGNGCVTPTAETIRNGSYAPLGRQLYLYVKRASLEDPGIKGFLEFFMANARNLIPATGYTPLPGQAYQENLQLLEGYGG
jgi:phosphate transport system substrate-binding protein